LLEDRKREGCRREAARRRIGKAVVLAAPRHRPADALDRTQHHQPIRIPDRQRAQQELVDQAENRRVGADAQRQRQHRRGGEATMFEEQAEREREIIHGKAPEHSASPWRV
jgi:hypothetical protein